MNFLHNFNYKIIGEDHLPKLVFLHGIMGSGNNWLKVTPSFKDFQVLIFDQRGHGRSFKPISGYSPEDFSQDLALILEELKWDKIYLVGHSMGGRNALAFAQNNAQHLSGLVIEDIGPGPKEWSNSKIKTFLDTIPAPFKSKETAKSYFENEFLEEFKSNPQVKALSQYFYMNIESKEGEIADWRFSKSGILEALEKGRNSNFWPLLKKLPPTLWVRGEFSEDLSRETLNKIKEFNSEIEVVEVLQAGHWVHSDNTQGFVDVLRKFLQKNPS
ncbi:MAG: alpha/beta hydrolase [Bdellovibrionales bacterium]|nr:alpha/beta hydrolase [Bdellovibrionales bacterium]